VNNPYLYTGRRNDAETNLYQYRHRYYSWRLGRFISRDPKGYVDGYNLYQYAGGRVVVMNDPMGLAGGGHVATPTAPTTSNGPTTVEIAQNVRKNLTEHYGRGGYYYGHSHCVSSCVLTNMTDKETAKAATQWKERGDVILGGLGKAGNAYSAMQSADYDANKAGRDAAENISLCPVEGRPLSSDQKIDAYFQMCIDECTKAGWGQWDAGPQPPSNIWSDSYRNRLKQHPELDYRDLPGTTVEELQHRHPPDIWAPNPPPNRDYRPVVTREQVYGSADGHDGEPSTSPPEW
jgi:RHS repeat-associated protein